MSFIKTMINAIFRTFGRFIAYIIIGVIVYLITSNFVFAAQYRYLNNDNGTGSWTNVSYNNTTYTNTPITTNTSGKTVFQFRDSTAMVSGNKYDLLLNFDYSVTATSISNSNIDAIGSVAIELYNGSTLKDISSQCTTNYVQTDTPSYENGVYSMTHRILGTIKCTAVEGAGYYPYFGFQFKRNNVVLAGKGTATIKFLSWSYSLNQGATDTNTIINNNNANTQSIINNNNYNSQQITGSINDIGDTLTDSSVDNPSSDFSSMESLVPTNGVVSGLLLLPVQLFQAVVNSVDGTCTDFNLGTLYNHNLTMPCINLSNKLGSALYHTIDIIISGILVLGIRKKFVDIFEHFTSLKTGGNELE